MEGHARLGSNPGERLLFALIGLFFSTNSYFAPFFYFSIPTITLAVFVSSPFFALISRQGFVTPSNHSCAPSLSKPPTFHLLHEVTTYIISLYKPSPDATVQWLAHKAAISQQSCPGFRRRLASPLNGSTAEVCRSSVRGRAATYF
jgi:hypothetical protein